MVRRNALRALATLGETGELRAGGDPFLRPAVRASVARSLDGARKVTSIDDTEHVARVAFLRESGLAQGLDPNDEPRVRALHEGAVEKLPRGSGPWPITMALLALLTAVAGFFVYKRFEPTPEERFRKSPFGIALGEPLGEFVVGLDRGTADKSVVLTPGVKKQLGEELFAELDDVLTKAAARDDSLQGSIDELNEQLARAKIPGYLDNYAHGSNVWLLSFFANQRADVALDGEKTHVAWGRRLDSLNLDTTFYVWMRAESRWAVVSLEMVEAKLGKELLPTLGGDRPLFYGDHLGGANSTRLSKALAEPLRSAFIAETTVPLDELKTIWEIVATLEDATDRIKAKKGLLVAHGSLLVAPQELKRLEKYRGKGNLDLDDALKAHDRLVGHRAALEKVVAVAAEVDEQTFVGEHLLLKKKAEPTEAARAAGISSAWGVAAARARLALLSDDKHAPIVYLEDMVRDIVARGNGAIAVVVRELARELGRKPPEGTVESATEALLNNVEAIVSKPRADVAAAARKVHERLFGAPAPHYDRTPM